MVEFQILDWQMVIFSCQRSHKLSMLLVSLGLNEVWWKTVSEMKLEKDSKPIMTSIRAYSSYRDISFCPMTTELEMVDTAYCITKDWLRV